MLQRACIVASLAVVVACSGQADPAADGPSFQIEVAPLELPGVADACYTLAVYNTPRAGIGGAGALVWTETSVCADQYGDNRGSLTYVGTCDASPDGRTNTVSLELEGLCQTDGCDPTDDDDPGTIASTTYVNPCPVGSPCFLERPCAENADTAVEFDLTIMRDASQGFFDFAVTFDDVFCSAKLDCVDAFLQRPGGARDLTAILAFACTSGADETCLYAEPVRLDCGGTNVWTIDPALGPGMIAESSPLLFAAATYKGDEAFTGFRKSYWNVALGLDEAAFGVNDCTLSWSTTASQTPLPGDGPFTTREGTTYPVLRWERDIIVDGALACDAHPLNQVAAGEETPSVWTAYTPIAEPATFAASNCAPEEPPLCAPGDPDGDGDGVPDACDTCPEGQDFQWVSWATPISGTTATGTVGGIGVTYTSSAALGTTPNVYAHNVFPASYGVPNVDPTIRNDLVTQNTLTFATAVTNPMLVFSSIGRPGVVVPVEFATPVRLLWCQDLLDGPTTSASPITCNGQTVTTIYGQEGYAIVEVPGTHTSIDFDYTQAESWANFVFGFNTCTDGGAPSSPITNGGFEAGTLEGWTTQESSGTGTSSVVSSFAGITPTEGAHMGLVTLAQGDFISLASTTFEWTSVSQVCLDIRALHASVSGYSLAQVVAKEWTFSQPVVASVEPAGSSYNYLKRYPTVSQPGAMVSTGDPNYPLATPWLSACFDTLLVAYQQGDSQVPLSFNIEAYGGNVAYLIDNVRVVP